jgi:hypothetical protein
MRWLWAFAGLLAGCEPEMMAMPDLSPAPADLAPQGCMPDFGKVFFVDTLRFMPPGEGFDLNGDGKIDNQMGKVAGMANPELQNSIKLGTTIMLVSVTHLKGPPIVDGDHPAVTLLLGLDSDSPADPSNNADNGAFKVPIEQFDVNCNPTTTFDSSAVSGGIIKSASKKVDIVAGSIGTIRWTDAQLTMTPSSPGDLTHWTGVTGGIGDACSLSITPFPGPNTASLLDVLVNLVGLQPDIDRDGDGIEKIVGDLNTVTIKECVDGDGTVIPGRNCVCDPRIKDGYSGALGFSLVPARVVGLVMSQ